MNGAAYPAHRVDCTSVIKLTLRYEWQPRPGRALALEPTLFRALHALHETGSLAAAARRLGMSYRHVWGLMGKWGKVFGKPLVVMQRGRGATLTAFGDQLLWAEQLVRARLAPELDSVRQEIERVLHDEKPSAGRLAVCASHDLALAALRDRLAQRDGLKLDLRFQGSIESLAALSGGACSLAGFHVAEGLEQSAARLFRRHLERRGHVLVGVATRTQGLMAARGNPKRIQSLADLRRGDVRIVNRQRGSGSRIEFDELLRGAGIDADAIRGYETEEFTHLAVAATVAGGGADAGYGIRAAAAQYGLHYIPLLTERYYLAGKHSVLRATPGAELLAMLRGEPFRELLAALPGYGDAITGRTFEVDEVLPSAGIGHAGSVQRAKSR